MQTTVSVIVATYTRARLLDECLQHLARQPLQAGDEIIVVDNGSTDDTQAVVVRHAAAFPVPLRLLFEPRPGKSHALARALGVARGQVLAFVDDDVNVDRRWLDTVRTTMTDPGVALMGGRVMPRWDERVAEWMRSVPAQYPRLGSPLALLDYPAPVVDLGPRTLLGANMAVRRDVVEAVGGFAPHLGKLRGTLLSGEDHEFCCRVQRAGYRAIYVADAVVHHWVPVERARVGYFLHWFYWSGITNALLDADAPDAPRGRTVWGVPLYLVKRAVVSGVASAAALIAGRRATALARAVDVAFAAGYAAQRWGLHARHGGAGSALAREAA